MKRYLVIAIISAILLPALSSAQEYVSTPVEISKEKVKIEGKVCYSHIVQEKQTLYSISKAYGVSIEDIYKFNPSVKEAGLKKNSIIIIPSAEALTAAPAPKQAVAKQVAAKKTEVISAEAAVPETVSAVPQKEKAQRIHIAKWHEDLDVISEMYGVSVEDIMAANYLKGRKLNKRHKLIIPYPGEEIPVPQVMADTVKAIADIVVPEPVIDSSLAVVIPKNEVNATLILPLTGNEGKPNRNNIDFYCGTLLAIYDLGNEGVDCKLNVYDIMDNKSQMNIETISNSDMIIGPVSTADLTRIFHAVPKAKAVISPLDQRAEKLTNEHPNMIQIPTPASAQYKDLVKWMEEEFMEGDRVVMISEKAARQNNLTGPIKEVLDSSSLAYQVFSYSILEGRDVTTPLTELMTPEGTNRVVIASESEAFVNDVVRNLNVMIHSKYPVILYGTSKFRSFETIEVENFHNTNMRVSLTYYIDYDNPKVKNFLLKYRALFNTEPTQFAFQGYDIATYFIEMCSKYGNSWPEKMPTNEKDMLQSTFKCTKDGDGGYVNQGVRRIVYGKDWSITRVR